MWNNYLYDKGIVPVAEPFKKLVHQGMILGSNGIKMGKRFPEFVVNPNDVVKEYGADTLRLYEMFMGPLEADKPWNNEATAGARKFLDRVWRLYTDESKGIESNKNLEKVYHQTVKKITEDYESLNFNTGISQLMIFVNAAMKEDNFPSEYRIGFLKLLNPIAPHITEELWSMMGNKNTIAYETWPTYSDEVLKESTKTLAVQVNGKVRATIDVGIEDNDEIIREKALNEENVIRHIDGKEIVKFIIIKDKIVNIVVK